MENIGLFYGSSTGTTKDLAEQIRGAFSSDTITMLNVNDCKKDAMHEYSKLIIGISTWGEGELQDDWEDYLPHMEQTDFSNATIAFFGVGDQDEYSENFLDAMGILYNTVIQRGATVIGSWPIDGYDFDESIAVVENEFVGLALDEDNQYDLSAERIKSWVEQIKPYFI